MNLPDRFSLLRKLLQALGLSEERTEELINRIQEWLQDDQTISGELEQHTDVVESVTYPYHIRDDFLSVAELNFYRVLQTAVTDWAIVFVKVSLGDLFFAQTGERGLNQAYRNKIDRKHVDFLLCDPQTMKPVLGIELDDKSHQLPERAERDVFVDGVFAAAKLPLVHVPVKTSYPTEKLNRFLRHHALPTPKADASPTITSIDQPETVVPHCPKCGADMFLRTAKSGPNVGGQFWGCANYPRCRGIMSLSST